MVSQYSVPRPASDDPLREEELAERDAFLGRADGCLRRPEAVPESAPSWLGRRDGRLRAALAGRFDSGLAHVRDELGPCGPGLPRLARLFGEAFPEGRLEARAENEARFARSFGAAKPRYLTATGRRCSDECRRRGLPSVVIQHGGPCGYEDRVSAADPLDFGHFASWVFGRAPRNLEGMPFPARVASLPEPRLSQALACARTRPAGPSTALESLSKRRTPDNCYAAATAPDERAPRWREFLDGL